LLWRLRLRRDGPFIKHHATQAVGIALLLVIVLVADFGLFAAFSYSLVYQRHFYQSLPLPTGWAPPIRDLLLMAILPACWFIAWLSGLLLALCGSYRSLPLVGRFVRRPLLLRLGLAVNLLFLITAALAAAAVTHASSLTRDDGKPAAVYLLYDDMGFVPRWVMNLGFYRMSLAARERWGPDNVIVARLDERDLREALRHGRFVFLAAHGEGGDILTARFQIEPPALADGTASNGLFFGKYDAAGNLGRWELLEANEDLRFVYNAACDGGSKADEWNQALAPAEVKTFDRLSATAEHLFWLWTEGPRRIQKL
jgi:hypothetical protein